MSGMSNLKDIPVIHEVARARSGEKYVTPQGFTAIRDGIKAQGGTTVAAHVSGKPSWLRARAPTGAGFQGVKAIVIDPVDSTAAASLVQQAQSQGIKVIAYDRPIPSAKADYYVSFDNEAIGKAIAQSLVQHLKASNVPTTDGGLLEVNGSPTDAAALKTAVMQQELMVAALQCREAAAYNRFVIAYRSELQSSDASLKAFFVRRGGEHGESGYDTFKTKAANLSALEQARDAKAFCADAHALFTAALAHRGSLMSFVNARSDAADIGNICVDSHPAPVLAKAETKAPATKAIPITAPVAAAIKAAASPVQVAVAGVPTYNVPAIPYRSEGAPPAPPTARGATPR